MPAQRKRASMLYFANVFLYLFFYIRLILQPWLTEVHESFTRGGPWVSLEKLLLGFFPGHLYWRPIGSRTWVFQRTHYGTPKIQDGRDPPSWNRHDIIFSAHGCLIWIRLVQNDMSTAVTRYPRATCHIAGCKNSICHIENRFRHILSYFCFSKIQFGLWRAAASVSSPIHLFEKFRRSYDSW